MGQPPYPWPTGPTAAPPAVPTGPAGVPIPPHVAATLPAPPPGYYWTYPPPAPPPGPKEPALDQTMAELRRRDPQPWGWRPVGVPLITLVALIVAGTVLSATVRPTSHGGAVAYAVGANLAVELVLALSVWFAGREVAARNGGWGVAFGWRRPKWVDVGWAFAGFGIALAARFVVLIVANVLSGGKAAEQSSNLDIDSVTWLAIVLLVFVAVLCAPVIEELVFRGLMLRTFMRRMSFWPAALLSSVIFAALHTYEVGTLVGALTLAAVVGTLAITNCVLVRITDRLAPGIGVHFISNGLSVLVAILIAS